MTEPIAARADCEHHYETRILGGHPITVTACTFCRTPDWPDLYEQAEQLFRWGREEALAGKPPRERLSAYDMPRQGDDPPGRDRGSDSAEAAVARVRAYAVRAIDAGDTGPGVGIGRLLLQLLDGQRPAERLTGT